MRNFTLTFHNVPTDDFFEGNEQVLKYKLMFKLMSLMEEQCFLEYGITFTPSDPQYQIVDINFGKSNMKDTTILLEMNKI